MIAVMHSEWARLWRRPWMWAILLGVPGMSYFSADYFMDMNVSSAILSNAFVIAGLQENLFFICNIVVAALIAAIFIEEFRGGQLRFVFLRQYSRKQIFFGKLFVIYGCIAVLLVWFAVCLWLTGWIMFPAHTDSHHSMGTVLFYVFDYYGLSFITLIGISNLFACIAIYSKNVTFMLGGCVLYILASLLLDNMLLSLAALFSQYPYVQQLITFLLMPYLQHTGLDLAASGQMAALVNLIVVVILYSILFLPIAYRRFVKSDYTY